MFDGKLVNVRPAHSDDRGALKHLSNLANQHFTDPVHFSNVSSFVAEQDSRVIAGMIARPVAEVSMVLDHEWGTAYRRGCTMLELLRATIPTVWQTRIDQLQAPFDSKYKDLTDVLVRRFDFHNDPRIRVIYDLVAGAQNELS